MPMLAVIILFIVVLAYYLGYRFHIFFPKIKRKFWVILFIAAVSVTHIAMLLFSTSENPFGRVVFVFSAISQGFLLYLLISILIFHLVARFIKYPQIFYGILSVLSASFFVIYGLINSAIPRLVEVTIPVRGLKNEIRAVHLSDIHLGHFRRQAHLNRIVNIVNQVNPDVVFDTGDLFDARSALCMEVLEPLKRIRVPHYFVEGNHDREVGADSIKKMLRQLNVRILDNQVASFGQLQLVGLKYMVADKESFDMHADLNGETIKDVLARLPIDSIRPTLMLHHSPNGEKYAEPRGIDLLLAGHTHKGQFFPFTEVAREVFKYNHGLYQYGRLAIYVSQGLGTVFTPIRIGSSSEVTLIHLVPG